MSSLPLKLGDLEESPFPVVYSFPAEVQLLYSQWFSNIAWRSNYSQVATVQIMTLAKALARSSGYCICIETLTKKYPRVTVNANVLPMPLGTQKPIYLIVASQFRRDFDCATRCSFMMSVTVFSNAIVILRRLIVYVWTSALMVADGGPQSYQNYVTFSIIK